MPRIWSSLRIALQPARPAARFLRNGLGSVALVVLVSACDATVEPYIDKPVAELYNQAMDLLAEEFYTDAANVFEEVERQHPYSMWATKAQVMAAYAYYQDNSYDEAIISAERFINLHPGNNDVPYAQYLIGLSYYERISDVGRDQDMTVRALEAFDELTRRFPESRYSRDARLKISLANDHLAGKEMEIGRTYQDLEFYLAGINRFRNVVERYQTTSHVPEALHRLTESYLALGLRGEAQSTAAVLGHNFPGSGWYQDSFALLRSDDLEPRLSERSWLARIF